MPWQQGVEGKASGHWASEILEAVCLPLNHPPLSRSLKTSVQRWSGSASTEYIE